MVLACEGTQWTAAQSDAEDAPLKNSRILSAACCEKSRISSRGRLSPDWQGTGDSPRHFNGHGARADLPTCPEGFSEARSREARGIFFSRLPDDRPTDLASVPILGTVPAGSPLLAEENILGQVMVDRKLVAAGRCFALRVTGESMRDAAIHDGDMVIVRQQQLAENGDIVVALLDDEATVKRLSIRADQIELRPENPAFKPLRIGPDHLLRIIGKVVAVRRQPGG